MEAIRRDLARLWIEIAASSPLPAYFAAICAGLEECARVAAKQTLAHSLEGAYLPEMERSPALSLHNLLTYHNNCRFAAQPLFTEILHDVTLDTPSDSADEDVGPQNSTLQSTMKRLQNPKGKKRVSKYWADSAVAAEDVVSDDIGCRPAFDAPSKAKTPSTRTFRNAWLYTYITDLRTKAGTGPMAMGHTVSPVCL